MKIKLDKIKFITGYNVKTNYKSIGLDIAERCGICNISTTDSYATIKFNFLEFDKGNINKLYKDMYNAFKMLILNQDIVIIEDSYLQRFGRFVQADVFKKLTRFGSLALAICLEKNIPREFILAKSSRSKLGIITTKKAGYGKGESKKAVADWLRNNLDIDLKGDDDASDAIVLALLGILEDLDFRSQANIDKVEKKTKRKFKKGLKKNGKTKK
jgi:hypothetical protein